MKTDDVNYGWPPLAKFAVLLCTTIAPLNQNPMHLYCWQLPHDLLFIRRTHVIASVFAFDMINCAIMYHYDSHDLKYLVCIYARYMLNRVLLRFEFHIPHQMLYLHNFGQQWPLSCFHIFYQKSEISWRKMPISYFQSHFFKVKN